MTADAKWNDRGEGPRLERPAVTAGGASPQVETHLSTAREMEAHGDGPAAIEQYEQALRLEPELSGVHARLAELYANLGQADRAEREFVVALAEDDGDAELWNDYAGHQLQTGRLEEAEKSARRALSLDAEHRRARVCLGLILAEQGRNDESLCEFEKAVPPAAAHHNLAIILARQGKADEARAEFAEARRIDPTLRPPPTVLKQLSEAYVQAAEAAEARDERAMRSSVADVPESREKTRK
ncbi:MAG: tetratricopeptide repeat protein [Pirellulales bacterium]